MVEDEDIVDIFVIFFLDVLFQVIYLFLQGVRRNCEKFIGMVTGCSGNTIWKVNQQMVETKGMRDPPEHGLKRYWENHPRRRAHVEEAIRHEEQDEKKAKKSRQKNNGSEVQYSLS